MLAHHFRSSISLRLDRRGVWPIHPTRAGVLLFLENSESCSIMAHPWESSQVLHLMNARLQQSLAA